MEQFGAKVPVIGPDIEEIIEALMVPGMLGPIIGRSVSEQLHHVWLQSPADDGEDRSVI